MTSQCKTVKFRETPKFVGWFLRFWGDPFFKGSMAMRLSIFRADDSVPAFALSLTLSWKPSPVVRWKRQQWWNQRTNFFNVFQLRPSDDLKLTIPCLRIKRIQHFQGGSEVVVTLSWLLLLRWGNWRQSIRTRPESDGNFIARALDCVRLKNCLCQKNPTWLRICAALPSNESRSSKQRVHPRTSFGEPLDGPGETWKRDGDGIGGKDSARAGPR
jgi:hypothetical protein